MSGIGDTTPGGRRWRRPAIVVVAGAHERGTAVARELLCSLPALTCPTIVSVRERDPGAFADLVDGDRVRDVHEAVALDEADVWIAPVDRNTTVRDGRLHTDPPGRRVAHDLPSLGALYHSVRVGYGSRVFAVVADPEMAGGTCLRLLRDRGACIVRPLELAPAPGTDHWSTDAIVDHLAALAGREAAPVPERSLR